jgi:hypothetical protein
MWLLTYSNTSIGDYMAGCKNIFSYQQEHMPGMVVTYTYLRSENITTLWNVHFCCKTCFRDTSRDEGTRSYTGMWFNISNLEIS